jgi:hypothetical protein
MDQALHCQRIMKTIQRMMMVLVMAGAAACASSRTTTHSPAARVPDTTAERVAGLREANPEANAEAVEARFSADAAKERRAADKAARDERQRRVDVVDKTKPRKK